MSRGPRTLALMFSAPATCPRLCPLCSPPPAGASPDYLFLLQRLMMDNPDAAVNLAKMVAKQVCAAILG